MAESETTTMTEGIMADDELYRGAAIDHWTKDKLQNRRRRDGQCGRRRCLGSCVGLGEQRPSRDGRRVWARISVYRLAELYW
jgi:hypothetical protein